MHSTKEEKIFITGGSGFLGGYLVKAAASEFGVVATYFRTKPQFSGAGWLRLDLSETDDMKAVIFRTKPAVIIHAAAMTNVDICENHKEETNQINIRATEVIAQGASKIGTKMIYLSTDLVFDGVNPPYDENDQPNPLNHYGWSKWQGELTVAGNIDNHLIVRPSIIFGPPAILGTSFTESLRKSWYEGKITKLFIDQFRTPIFAGNLASALMELIKRDYVGTLHIGGVERVSRYQFGQYLSELLETRADLIQKSNMSEIDFAAKRPNDVSMNIELARSVLKTELLDCGEGIKEAYLK